MLIAVSDNGVGMTPEVAAQAFDPFFTTKPPGQGTGLGLSQVFGFVKQSGGHVAIETTPGEGTSVQMFFPGVPRETDEKPIAAKGIPGTPGRGETVLLVEDDRDVRAFGAELLAELGYRVLVQENGPEAIAILRSQQPVDLLLTDVGLPGMNGRELAERARDLRPGMPILFMSGYNAFEPANEGTGGFKVHPNSNLLVKPFTLGATRRGGGPLVEGACHRHRSSLSSTLPRAFSPSYRRLGSHCGPIGVAFRVAAVPRFARRVGERCIASQAFHQVGVADERAPKADQVGEVLAPRAQRHLAVVAVVGYVGAPEKVAELLVAEPGRLSAGTLRPAFDDMDVDKTEVVEFLDQGRIDRPRIAVVRAEPVRGRGQPDAGAVATPDACHGFGHFIQHDANATGDAAAVTVGAVVGAVTNELLKQVLIGGVDLHPVEARVLGAVGGVRVIGDLCQVFPKSRAPAASGAA